MSRDEFEDIARQIRQTALAAALSANAGADNAEDVAQEVSLRLWTLHAELANADHALRLASCAAHNLTIDNHRRKRSVSLDDRRFTPDKKTPSADSRIEEMEDMAWLMDRLRALPPKEYQILRLRQVEQKTNTEIAALLGIEKTSVATLLSRARQKMFNEIKRRINS